MTSRRQLEAAWAKAKQPISGKPAMLFDRRRRINLLWELFFIGLFLLLLVALIAGVR